MKNNIYRRHGLLFIFSFFLLMGIHSQDLTNNFKIWYGLNVNTKITQNLRVKFGALYGQNTNPSGYSFMQGNLGLSYKIMDGAYFDVGYSKELLEDSQTKRDLYNITPGLFNKLEFNRIYTSFSYKHDIVKRLSIKHEIEAQFFIPAVQKYKNRFIYSARLAYNVRKSSLVPYLENEIYYYSGGVIENGFNKHRILSGIQFKPIKDFPLSTSIYYLYQNEFNTTPINENDYSALGISLSFTIK